MKILAIESSCDETAAALLEVKKGVRTLHTNVVASQIAIHAQYGGVVPEVAARNHVMNVVPVIAEAIGKTKPDCIAVTLGPGLITSLLVGVEAARCLSYLWDVPLVSVNHIEGHIYSNWLEGDELPFPLMVLIVSGGHTELILLKKHGSHKVVGRTKDDAAGEAFDKVAKILDLGYPGGPIVSKRAANGDPLRFNLPRPLIANKDFDFSFSGLKTAALYTLRDAKKEYADITSDDDFVNDFCASFQQAAIDVLVSKTLAAAKHYKVKGVLFGGGVMANKELRKQLEAALKKKLPDVEYRFPSPGLCTDNAAMIASIGYVKASQKKFVDWKKIDADSNWEL